MFWMPVINGELRMEKIINIFICVIVGLLVLFLGFLFVNGNISSELIDKLKILSYILISLSLIIAIMQFRENLKQSKKVSYWNKKQITVQQLHTSRKVLQNTAEYLNNFLNTRRKEPYSIVEIHSFFGVVINWNILNDKEKKIFEDFFKGHIQKEDDIYNVCNGKEYLRFVFYKAIDNKKDENIKNILDKEGLILTDKQLEDLKLHKFYYHQKWKNYNGKKLYKELHNFLSEYEYIATALNENIFDINIIDNLMGSGIIYAYRTFKEYIKHLRIFHTVNTSLKTIYIQFEKMTESIKKRRS